MILKKNILGDRAPFSVKFIKILTKLLRTRLRVLLANMLNLLNSLTTQKNAIIIKKLIKMNSHLPATKSQKVQKSFSQLLPEDVATCQKK